MGIREKITLMSAPLKPDYEVEEDELLIDQYVKKEKFKRLRLLLLAVLIFFSFAGTLYYFIPPRHKKVFPDGPVKGNDRDEGDVQWDYIAGQAQENGVDFTNEDEIPFGGENDSVSLTNENLIDIITSDRLSAEDQASLIEQTAENNSEAFLTNAQDYSAEDNEELTNNESENNSSIKATEVKSAEIGMVSNEYSEVKEDIVMEEKEDNQKSGLNSFTDWFNSQWSADKKQESKENTTSDAITTVSNDEQNESEEIDSVKEEDLNSSVSQSSDDETNNETSISLNGPEGDTNSDTSGLTVGESIDSSFNEKNESDTELTQVENEAIVEANELADVQLVNETEQVKEELGFESLQDQEESATPEKLDNSTEEVESIDDDLETSKVDNSGTISQNFNEVSEKTNVSESVTMKPEFSATLRWVEKMPEFPGGEVSMYKFLNENIIYPQAARDLNIQGIVIVEFLVDPTGTLSDFKLVRGLGFGCDEEALRVVGLMPSWKPGSHQGHKVPVRYSLPIKFRLIN